MKTIEPDPKIEKFYVDVIQKKSSNEKLQMLDEFFKFAKKINPEYFKCRNQLKIRRTS